MSHDRLDATLNRAISSGGPIETRSDPLTGGCATTICQAPPLAGSIHFRCVCSRKKSTNR
jgi:hypothetical protein